MFSYFFDHFCDIADSALLRVLKEKDEAKQSKRMSELERFASVRIFTGDALHGLTRLTKKLTEPIRALEFAAQERLLDDELREKIFSLQPSCDEFRNKLTELRKALTENETRPCSLDDVIKEVCDQVAESWLQEGIRLERSGAAGCSIDVSFRAASIAVETLLNNGRDAIASILNGNNGDHRIHIDVSDLPNKVICTITDTGPGIRDDLRPILTKSPVDSTRIDGNGMGLYFASFILRGYRSDIIPEPTKGKGAVFSIHFRKPELGK